MKKLDIYKYHDLKSIRTFRGISQKILSEWSGVNLRMIQNYEQGTKDIKKASIVTIKSLAVALDCSIDDLMGWSYDEQLIINVGLDTYIEYMTLDSCKDNPEHAADMINDYIKTKYQEYKNIINLDNVIDKIIKEYEEI